MEGEVKKLDRVLCFKETRSLFEGLEIENDVYF
jgi:hypothetical protein